MPKLCPLYLESAPAPPEEKKPLPVWRAAHDPLEVLLVGTQEMLFAVEGSWAGIDHIQGSNIVEHHYTGYLNPMQGSIIAEQVTTTGCPNPMLSPRFYKHGPLPEPILTTFHHRPIRVLLWPSPL